MRFRKLALRHSGIRVQRLALPPLLFRAEEENCEMEVRMQFIGVSGRADIADNLPSHDAIAFSKAVLVPVKVGVVIGILFRGIEFVDCESTGHAGEQLGDPAALGRYDGLSPGSHDVDCFMTALTTRVEEVRVQVLGPDPWNWYREVLGEKIVGNLADASCRQRLHRQWRL